MSFIATEMGDSPRGIYVIVPTPLKDNEELDSAGLKHLLNYYVKSGCHGVVVLGSGGEFASDRSADSSKRTGNVGRSMLEAGATCRRCQRLNSENASWLKGSGTHQSGPIIAMS